MLTKAITIPLLKNMYLTTADRLLILNGCPLSTMRFVTILSGFTECRLPVAISSCWPTTHIKTYSTYRYKPHKADCFLYNLEIKYLVHLQSKYTESSFAMAVLPSCCSLNTRTGQGGNDMGANIVAMVTISCAKNLSNWNKQKLFLKSQFNFFYMHM